MKHPPRNIVIDWINTIWTTDLTANSKLLACNLRRYMNSTNDMAWPSIARIAGECNLSEQCVRKHLKILCAEGWLQQLGQSNSGTFKYQAQYPPAIIAPLQSFAPPPAMVAAELNKELNNNIYKGFKPPSVEEVKDYSSTIDAERFVDFYACKGWMVGKNRMKDWKAAARNWERNNKKQRNTAGTTRNTSLEQDLNDKSWAGL